MKTVGSYIKRVRALGWPFLLTGLAFLLGVIALTQPVWSYEQATTGGNVDRWTYGWSVVTEEVWQNGVWAGTTVMPYSSPSFTESRMREAVTTSYSIAAVYVASLFVLALVQFIAKPRKIPQSLTFLVTLAAFALGIATAAYSAFAVPAAAGTDISSSISSLTGSVFVNGPGSNDYTLSWGAAAGWWMWAASLALTAIVFIVPLLQRKPWARASPAH